MPSCRAGRQKCQKSDGLKAVSVFGEKGMGYVRMGTVYFVLQYREACKWSDLFTGTDLAADPD